LKYSKFEAFSEIQERESIIRKKRYRRQMPLLGGSILILLAAMVWLFSLLCSGMAGIVATSRSYGTIMISAGMGEYVLAAVLAFVAGAVLTVVCLKNISRHPTP